MLPGVIVAEQLTEFVCKFIQLKVENAATRFTSECEVGDVLKFPLRTAMEIISRAARLLNRLQENGQHCFSLLQRSRGHR